MARPFALSHEPATILAQLTCHDGKLPQGAPSSPIISNIICHKLDRQLADLAWKCRASYSRYADDITFSGNHEEIPDRLVGEFESGSVVLSANLRALIEANGFQINDSKVRLATNNTRKEVTGIIVNRLPNLRRTYIRNLRSMIHAWEKFGEDNAAAHHFAKSKKHRNPALPVPRFSDIVHGKLSYLKMVKGGDDAGYRDLLLRYCKLTLKPIPAKANTFATYLHPFLWVIESESALSQGTAFAFEDVGLVTCYHCVAQDGVILKDLIAYRQGDKKNAEPIKIIKILPDCDLAILSKPGNWAAGLPRHTRREVNHDENYIVAGFPNHAEFDTLYTRDGKITNVRRVGDINHYLLTSPIIAGMSGGPVINQSRQVIGVTARGGKTFVEANQTEDNRVIAIENLDMLK